MRIQPLWVIMIAVVLAGCSSARKAELAAGNDATQAVAEVTNIMQKAQREQLDVLADKQFAKGRNYLSDAEQGLKQGKARESVLENAAIAKAFFEDARKTAQPRKSVVRRILRARKSALNAGVRKSDALVERLMDIDDDLKSETSRFSKALSPDDYSELQKKYLALEVKAVQFRKLNSVKQAIDQAAENDADDLAPKSLRDASLDYKTALNMIAQSPRNPKMYNKSVREANTSSTKLTNVMNVILGAKGTPEHIAEQIVKQQQSLQEKEGALQSQQEQLALASTQVRFQKAMDEARKVIPQSDALVYQQGNRLVFRLKRINFRSGTSIIPETSKPLISKVDSIIKKLNAKKVVVQGHTDSVGSAKVNKKLSTKRATAVASYLSSLRSGYKVTYVGYGESNPIASNETALGRATNRRVDLVVSVKQ